MQRCGQSRGLKTVRRLITKFILYILVFLFFMSAFWCSGIWASEYKIAEDKMEASPLSQVDKGWKMPQPYAKYMEPLKSLSKVYEQAAAYAAQWNKWLEGEGTEVWGNYLLYDMDLDGSLEVIVNVMQGTGRYSQNHFYSMTDKGEVEELPLVRLCDGKEREWGADFDLVQVQNKAYQDKDGIIYYEGNDFTREGIYGGYDETGFYYLKEGTVYQDSIRRCSRFTDMETEVSTVNYYSMDMGEDNEITDTQYEEIRDRYVRGMVEKDIYFEWINFSQNESLGKISEEMILQKLLESYFGSV